MRNTSASPAGSWAISSRIFVAAPSVRLTSASCSIVAICLIVATCFDGISRSCDLPAEPNFVTPDTPIVERNPWPVVPWSVPPVLARTGRGAYPRWLPPFPHVRGARGRDPGVHDPDVVRVRAAPGTQDANAQPPLRARRLQGPAAPEPLHDQ